MECAAYCNKQPNVRNPTAMQKNRCDLNAVDVQSVRCTLLPAPTMTCMRPLWHSMQFRLSRKEALVCCPTVSTKASCLCPCFQPLAMLSLSGSGGTTKVQPPHALLRASPLCHTVAAVSAKPPGDCAAHALYNALLLLLTATCRGISSGSAEKSWAALLGRAESVTHGGRTSGQLEACQYRPKSNALTLQLHYKQQHWCCDLCQVIECMPRRTAAISGVLAFFRGGSVAGTGNLQAGAGRLCQCKACQGVVLAAKAVQQLFQGGAGAVDQASRLSCKAGRWMAHVRWAPRLAAGARHVNIMLAAVVAAALQYCQCVQLRSRHGGVMDPQCAAEKPDHQL